jgi:hypothetical protein
MMRRSSISRSVLTLSTVWSLAACACGCGGASASGAMAAHDDRIDPLAARHSWTYDVQVLGTSPVCIEGRHSATVREESTVLGQHAFKIESFCPGLGSSYYAAEGDKVQLDYQDAWVLLLDAPVEEGHSWTNGVSVFTWHDAGSVTVPAGSFSNCWKATETANFTAYTVFCRGVGPVHWYRKDAAGNGIDAQLVSKNF